MPTIFYHYLGGEIKIDTTWASVTQLTDTRTKELSEEILTKLNIPRDILPEIVPPGPVTGKLLEPIADLLHLNRSILIAVASHDTASVFAAAPVKHPDSSLIISSGTWSLIGKIIDDPITSPEAMSDYCSMTGQKAPPDRGASLRLEYESLAMKYLMQRVPTEVPNQVGHSL